MIVVKTYKFKLYQNKKNKYLNNKIDIAGYIWNYCIALHKRYYKIFGKGINKYSMINHLGKIKHRKYKWWKELDAQAIQDVAERIDKSYQAFFRQVKQKKAGRKSPPKFKKVKNYTSFTLKQNGYKFLKDSNTVIIMKRNYKYFKDREIEGDIKTVTVKRNKLGEVFLYVVVKQECNDILSRAGKAVGMDFGLKHFLTLDDGRIIDSPEFYKNSLSEIRKAQRAVLRCKIGSNNRKRAILHLNRIYEKMSNRRRDWFYKLANQLVSDYAVICIEDLNIDGMKRLWGRKISDYAFYEFVTILEWVAFKAGTQVVKIDRFAPSSKQCHVCGNVNKELTLKQRSWECSHCHAVLDRDVNAAINIKQIGLNKLGYIA